MIMECHCRQQGYILNFQKRSLLWGKLTILTQPSSAPAAASQACISFFIFEILELCETYRIFKSCFNLRVLYCTPNLFCPFDHLRLFKSFEFGNGSRMSDEKLVIFEFKYLQNKKWQKQAIKGSRIRKSSKVY